MTISNMIQEIIGISINARQPNDSEEFDFSTDIHLLNHASENTIKARSILKNLFDGLSEEDIRRLHALMYAAPGKENPLAVKQYYYGTTETRDSLTRTMLEKIRGLAAYLTTGCKQAEIYGLDIDSF